MKYFFCSLFVFLVCCFLSCKKKNVENEQIGDALTVVDTISGGVATDYEQKGIEDDFKEILLKESAKWSISLEKDIIGESWINNIFLDDTTLLSHKTVLYSDKKILHGNISINAYVYKGIKPAMKKITGLCEDYHKDVLKGKTSKIAFRAFRKDSVIYEIATTSNAMEHVVYLAFQSTRDKYSICADEVIPCERNFISKELADKIKPAINKWLKYHEVDINYFHSWGYTSEEVNCCLFNEPFTADDTLSLYYREYEKKIHDVYNPVLYDYSPDKNYYLNVLETSGVFKDDDGKWYYIGGDDCQEIYLTNRKSQQKGLVLWLGASQFAEAAFWADNKMYIITGIEHDFPSRLFIWVGGKYFTIERFEDVDRDYFIENIKSRGVITDEN